MFSKGVIVIALKQPSDAEMLDVRRFEHFLSFKSSH